MIQPILVAKGLELGYDDEPRSWRILIFGASILTTSSDLLYLYGAGKTTFVRALLGLITPRKGEISYYNPEGGVEVPNIDICHSKISLIRHSLFR